MGQNSSADWVGLSGLQNALSLFLGRIRISKGSPFQGEEPTMENARRCLVAVLARGTNSCNMLISNALVGPSRTVSRQIVNRPIMSQLQGDCMFAFVCYWLRTDSRPRAGGRRGRAAPGDTISRGDTK